MQRRAAALYASFFLVIAAGSYATIAITEQPTVTVADPDYSRGPGESLAAHGRTFTVGQIAGGSTDLLWTNESEYQTATFENGTSLPAANVQWPGQQARYDAALRNGSTLQYQGVSHRLRINASAEPPAGSLVNLTSGNETTRITAGDELRYRGNETTVMAVTPANVTLVWGDPYRVLIPNASAPGANVTDPSGFAFRQVWDVEEILRTDPLVENATVTREGGRRYVVYLDTNRTEPLSAYLNPPDVKHFSEGESFGYNGTEVLVENVTASEVVVSWYGPVTHARSLAENETIRIGGTEYVAHFPGDGSLVLTADVQDYRSQVRAREYYTERRNGLWGVTILSGLAAVFLLTVSYLPSRY